MGKIFTNYILPLLGSGGLITLVVTYFKYKETKPKNDADVIVTFANGWERYANKLEDNNDKLNKRIDDQDTEIATMRDNHIKEIEALKTSYEQRISQLQESILTVDANNKKVIEAKDAEILDLQGRIEILEEELKRYQQR